jgi:hypothetical protein
VKSRTRDISASHCFAAGSKQPKQSLAFDQQPSWNVLLSDLASLLTSARRLQNEAMRGFA